MSETAQEIAAQEIEGQEEIPFVTEKEWMYNSATPVCEPEITTQEIGGWVVDAEFFYALQQMSVACGKEDRPALWGVCVERNDAGDGLKLIVTDTYRLWLKQVEARDVVLPENTKRRLIIPKDFIKKIIPQIIKENGGKRGFAWKGRNVPFKIIEIATINTYKRREEKRLGYNSTIEEFGDLVKVKDVRYKMVIGMDGQYETDLITGQFVNYPRVIPSMDAVKQTVGISGKALTPALEFCSAVASVDCDRVMLQFDHEGTLTVRAAVYEASAGAVASASYPLKCGETVDMKFQIGLNHQYMLDFIGDYPGHLGMNFFGHLNSFLITKGDNDLYVQMPMQLFDSDGKPTDGRWID